MAVPKRAKASMFVKTIPLGVSKARYYWAILKKHLAYYAAFDKKSFWIGMAAGLSQAPLGAVTIFISGLFVDSIVDFYRDPSRIFASWFPIPVPIVYIIGLFIIARANRLLDMVYNVALVKLRNNTIAGYRADLAEKFHKLNSQEIDKEQVKDLITKIESYWFANATSFYQRLTGVGQYLLAMILAMVALLAINPWIALMVMLVPIPEIIVVFKNFRRHAHFVDDITPLMLEKNYYFSALTDARTFPERKINGVFRSLITRYRQVAGLVADGYKRVLIRAEHETAAVNVFDNVLLVVLKCYVLLSSIVDKVPVGRITYIIGYIDSMYRNSYDLQNNLICLVDELSFLEYLYQFFEIKGFADERKKGKHLKQGSPKIVLEDASFTYPDNGKVVFSNVNLEIKPGERVMILGKDGTGKSSLLALLAGMYELTSGAIKFNGVPISKLARGQIKIKMSVVPEDFARYYMTLRENIVLGDPKKLFDSTLYKQALSITGLDKWAKANNIDDEKTILGNYFEDSVSISSGHWQRIAIARAVYRNREIFLLDQPFTYIDSHSVEEILPKLLSFIGKRTVIWISEHTQHLKHFTKAYELEDKQIVAIPIPHKTRRVPVSRE